MGLHSPARSLVHGETNVFLRFESAVLRKAKHMVRGSRSCLSFELGRTLPETFRATLMQVPRGGFEVVEILMQGVYILLGARILLLLPANDQFLCTVTPLNIIFTVTHPQSLLPINQTIHQQWLLKDLLPPTAPSRR